MDILTNILIFIGLVTVFVIFGYMVGVVLDEIYYSKFLKKNHDDD